MPWTSRHTLAGVCALVIVYTRYCLERISFTRYCPSTSLPAREREEQGCFLGKAEGSSQGQALVLSRGPVLLLPGEQCRHRSRGHFGTVRSPLTTFAHRARTTFMDELLLTAPFVVAYSSAAKRLFQGPHPQTRFFSDLDKRVIVGLAYLERFIPATT